MHGFGGSKVGQFADPVSVDQDVGSLEIAVDNFVRVEVL